jgi:hypothetical protein
LRDKRTVVRTFADWLRRGYITVDAINESHVAAFLKRTPGRLPPRLKYKHAALSGFLKYLRRVGLVSAPIPRAASPGDDLITEYVEYLRHDCGLAPNSVLVYVPLIRDWLSDHVAQMGGVAMDAFDAATIQHFLVDHTRNRSREYARLLGTALRSFFGFSFCGGTGPRTSRERCRRSARTGTQPSQRFFRPSKSVKCSPRRIGRLPSVGAITPSCCCSRDSDCARERWRILSSMTFVGGLASW